MRLSYSHLKITDLLVLLTLAVICFAVYANTLGYGFVLDDNSLIVNNPYIRNLKFFPSFFSTDLYRSIRSEPTGYYRPLLLISYAVDYAAWKLNPLGFHLTNILVHILNGYLAFLLLQKLFGSLRLAFGTAVLFCVHPVQTSAVAYIAGRADLLCAAFLLTGLLCLLHYFNTGRLRSYALMLVSIFAAFLSRENSLLFPMMAFLVAIHCRRRLKKIIPPLAGILAVACFYSVNRVLLVPTLEQAASLPLSPLPLPLALLNILNILKTYALLIFFPYPLYPMKTIPVIQAPSAAMIVFIILLAALIIATIKNRWHITGFGLLWGAIGLLPLFVVIYISPTMGLMMAEHWLYLPSIGIFTVLIHHSLALRKNQSLWLIFLSCAFGLSTIAANPIWKDDVTLSRHILKFSPDNGVAYLDLAGAYYRTGRYDEALSTLASLSSLEPYINWRIQNTLGQVYEAKKDLPRAIFYYQKAARIQPRSFIAYYNLGRIYLALGLIPDAYQCFWKAWENNPKSDIVYLGLGDLYDKLRRPPLALSLYEKGLKINPASHILLLKSANYLQEMGQNNQARQLLERILADQEISLQDLKGAAAVYGNMADFKKAISLWRKVLQRDPSDHESLSNIQKALELQKRA